MTIHPLEACAPVPRLFTYPFCYEPHPLAVAAARELQAYITESGVMLHEHGCGKMFGVLVVQTDGRHSPDGQPTLAFLAAYSGLLAGRNDWSYFVPPVYDAQQVDGHFKQTEREISAINREIRGIESDPMYIKLMMTRQEYASKAAAGIETLRQEAAAAKLRRHSRRESGAAISDEELAAMTRESQYMKAELRRRRHDMEQRLADFDSRLASVYTSRLDSLRRRRRQMSDDLQRWLFGQYRMLNALGEERDLTDIFAHTVHAAPPAGAGDCCAPKLLQYAYRHGLRPVCMAEFWWGESPRHEVRHHLSYYPACRSKCLPILTHMLRGLDVEPDPLAADRATKRLETVYEDEYMIVVDKPSGMLSVPGRRASDGSAAPMSVEEVLRQRVADGHGAQHLATNDDSTVFMRAAHRLDMDTSGLMIVARNERVLRLLQEQFAKRTVTKRYEAVLDGTPALADGTPTKPDAADDRQWLTVASDRRSGTISLPLSADITDRPRQCVDFDHGKPSLTDFSITATDGPHTLVSLWPRTGRTHQLRLHCAHRLGLGTPIVGDPLYGRTSQAGRMMLHAAEISLHHPVTGAPLHFLSPSGFSLK